MIEYSEVSDLDLLVPEDEAEQLQRCVETCKKTCLYSCSVTQI
ncbi:hypothetical protein [Streptomyces sp. NPDC055607]